MDPLTQGVLGSVAGQQLAKPKQRLLATVFGFLSGMAPDIDVLFRSDQDPLLALEFHRQFTHSLLFIPIGGLLCTVVFFLIFRRLFARSAIGFKTLYIYCTMGYASHGLLDACTTYGTQLLWPLSDMRVAWNTISIIDPLLTIPLLILVILAVVRSSRYYSVAALCWLLSYSAFGVVQRERAEALAWEQAIARGHEVLTLEAKPSFANLLVWKVVYRTPTHFYVDAARVGIASRYYAGTSAPILDVGRDFPWLSPNSQQAIDIERFRWFSNDYLALSPDNPLRIIDIRYSMIPNEIKGLWGIELSQQASEQSHVSYVTNRERSSQSFATLWNMIVGASR